MIDAHRGAFEYDWRSRFHLPLAAVGEDMSYGETWRLLDELLLDPSSHVSAALGTWEHPASREALVLMDLYDLQHRSKTKKKPKPYPRPWAARTTKRTAPAVELTQNEIVAALRIAGHTAPLPTR